MAVNRFVAKSMIPDVYREMVAQIDAETGDARRFMELGVPREQAVELASEITEFAGDQRRLMETSMVEVLAEEVAADLVDA